MIREIGGSRGRALALSAMLGLAVGLGGSVTVVQTEAADLIGIGEVTVARSTVYGTPPERATATLGRADPVFADERIETVRHASAKLRLADDSEIDVGEASVLTLDALVYDPNTKTGEMVVDLGVGVFRFVTGKVPKDGVRINTPSATLGVRGTVFSVLVAISGAISVSVESGIVTIIPKATGETSEVGAGSEADVGTDGSVDIYSPPFGLAPPTGLAPDAGGAPGSSPPGASEGVGGSGPIQPINRCIDC